MVENIKTLFFISVAFLFIILVMAGCSDPNEILAPPETNPIEEIYKSEDPIPSNGKEPQIYPLNKYIEDCYQEEWYFCPPLDAVWQFKIITDTCKMPPLVIEIGECIEKFECDPSNTSVEILDCMVDGGQGTQEKWCDKGFWKYGPCDPCFPEICDGKDNDCDDSIDEDIDIVPCESECGPGDLICIGGELECIGPPPEEEICDYKDNDCNGLIDEGQRNDCDECGPVAEEICNGFDDDCDGKIDEDLIQQCETDCEKGLEFCVAGAWIGCTAQQPWPEQCNGFDDNCNGEIDEGLDCGCAPALIGVLFPCFEHPLICGGGYKTCECEDEDCDKMYMTECLASCHWIAPEDPNCDKYLGLIFPEMCNNHDDNCNQLIDEDLVQGCYTGPPNTLYVGICEPGQMICFEGNWGNYYTNAANEDIFVSDLCLGEVVPLEKDACNGTDENCDGIVDDGKEMEDTDILFIVDFSGSMWDEIDAVFAALEMFAVNYSDESVIRWGLMTGPQLGQQAGIFTTEYLIINTFLTDFQQFLGIMSGMANTSVQFGTGKEMMLDALYLSILNLATPMDAPYLLIDLAWHTSWNVFSTPTLDQFSMNWREDANHVIVVFTDEPVQSYLDPMLFPDDILKLIPSASELSIYTFTNDTYKSKQQWSSVIQEYYDQGWEQFTSPEGRWYLLTSNAATMYESLIEILDETACQE